MAKEFKCKNCNGEGVVFVNMSMTVCPVCGGDGHCLEDKRGISLKEILKENPKKLTIKE